MVYRGQVERSHCLCEKSQKDKSRESELTAVVGCVFLCQPTKLQNKIRRASPAEKETLRQEKSGVTERITELRKQLKLIKGIEERSVKFQEKTDLFYANEYRVKEVEQHRKSQRKECDAR